MGGSSLSMSWNPDGPEYTTWIAIPESGRTSPRKIPNARQGIGKRCWAGAARRGILLRSGRNPSKSIHPVRPTHNQGKKDQARYSHRGRTRWGRPGDVVEPSRSEESDHAPEGEDAGAAFAPR